MPPPEWMEPTVAGHPRRPDHPIRRPSLSSLLLHRLRWQIPSLDVVGSTAKDPVRWRKLARPGGKQGPCGLLT